MAEREKESGLRSIVSTQKRSLIFKNEAKFDVTVYWVDYQGKWICYTKLIPHEGVAVETYATHPWVFEDEGGRRYLAGGKEVFYADSLKVSEGLRPIVAIYAPFLSLCEVALDAVAALLPPEAPSPHSLCLPPTLARQLENSIKRTCSLHLIDELSNPRRPGTHRHTSLLTPLPLS